MAAGTPSQPPASTTVDPHAEKSPAARALARRVGPLAGLPLVAGALAGGLAAAGGLELPAAIALTAAAGGGAVAVAAWVSVRRLAGLERDRMDSEERFRIFRREAGIGMFEWDLSQPYATGTPEYFAMMGMPRDKGTFTKEEWAEKVHPDDRARAGDAVEALVNKGRPYDIEFRSIMPDGSARWYANRAVLFRTREGKPARILGAMVDIDDLKRTEAQVRERERMFRRMADDAPVTVWLSDADGRLVFLSRSYYAYTGHDPDKPPDDIWLESIHPDDRPAVLAVWEHANRTREPFSIDLRARRHDGVWRWKLDTATPRFEEDRFVGYIGSVVDIAARKEAEERHELLMREVDHRAKNVLALVLSVLRVTRADSMEAYVAAVEGRVEAMARAHVLLAESRWYGARLQRLVEDELGSLRGGAARVEIEGPAVTILADAVQPMTIVLHELVTNAAKHGALSGGETGSLSVTWMRTPEGGLAVEWREAVGHPVAPPSRQGFGRMLIETLVARQLGGTITFTWAENGLHCRLDLSAALVSARAPDAEPDAVGGAEAAGGTASPSGSAVAAPDTAPPPAAPPRRRVLVVEDDVLVALGLEQMLEDLKYEVIGPAHGVEDALALLERERPDAALLDINLGGMLSTAVARRLRKKGVRFAYCTGYSDRGDTGVEAPTIIKPVSAGQLSKMLTALLRNPPPNRARPALPSPVAWTHGTGGPSRR
ncbi:hypothetical protein C882_1091 [Caenispirillum salinarum AK4]|uniref:histidine kinase n=2 Tax=Caenispirillum TaxID=414051 RepID=K9GQ71_9PROT|nr:hypothetical protein C882_1091 [Caenispirillum salinarum AK4]